MKPGNSSDHHLSQVLTEKPPPDRMARLEVSVLREVQTCLLDQRSALGRPGAGNGLRCDAGTSSPTERRKEMSRKQRLTLILMALGLGAGLTSLTLFVLTLILVWLPVALVILVATVIFDVYSNRWFPGGSECPLPSARAARRID